MKFFIKPVLLFILFFNYLYCEVKVNYTAEEVGFELVGSTFTEIVIDKKDISETSSIIQIVFGTVTIKNIGSTSFDISLAISTMTGNTRIVSVEPTKNNQYRFFAMFTDFTPSCDAFSSDDVLLHEKKISTDKIFAKDTDPPSKKGYNVNPKEIRQIFFRLDVSTNISVSGLFSVNITAIPCDENVVTVTPSGGDVEIFNRVKLEVPPGALTEDKQIKIVRKDKEYLYKFNNLEPVCAYEFTPKGLVFRKPVKLIINYRYYGVTDEDKLRIYFWDGYEWRYVGGNVDKTNKTVTTYISHFSVYALFAATVTPEYKPREKIITPALKDGINDVATFDGLSGKDVEIKIFDITGRKIKSINVLKKGNIWDGTDEYGNIVESGVYIYQFELDGKTYSGTITVAK